MGSTLNFNVFSLSFRRFSPKTWVLRKKIPEFLEKRSEFRRKPEFYADLSFVSSVKTKSLA